MGSGVKRPPHGQKRPERFLNNAKRWPACGRASGMRRVVRRPSLQGCIYGDFTERPLFPTEKHGIVC